MSAHDSRSPGISELARAILAEFAARFPESAHYRGGRRLRMARWEQPFPGIARDVEQKEAFLESVEELCALGVIEVKWQRFRPGSEVEALYLKDPDQLFSLLGCRTPEDIRRKMLAVLASPPWEGRQRDDASADFLDPVREHLRALLNARHPLPVEHEDDLRDLGKLLQVTGEQALAYPIRALSVRVFADSKRLEALLRVADKVTQQAVGESFSESRGLTRSYPEVSLALIGTLVLANGRVRSHGELLSLPGETVRAIDGIELSGSSVLSVENKESFYVLAHHLQHGNLPDRFGAVTYCGGYPHRAYGLLLHLFAQSGAGLYHFGDLDADGLLILQETERAAAHPVSPFGMDAALYHRFLKYGFELPVARLDRLRATLDSLSGPAQELARAVLEHRRGVEQEVTGLDDLIHVPLDGR